MLAIVLGMNAYVAGECSFSSEEQQRCLERLTERKGDGGEVGIAAVPTFKTNAAFD